LLTRLFKPRCEEQALSSISLDGTHYPVDFRPHPQARHIKLRTDPARRTILITMPPLTRRADALAFAHSQKIWILQSFAKAGVSIRLRPGEHFPFRGIERQIIWSSDQTRMIRLGEEAIYLGGPQDSVGNRLTLWLKAQARTAIARDTAFYCERAGEQPVKSGLSNARRRWGSCSAERRIRINWRLIMAPDFVRRSVIAHEIAHLRHMNHSADFYRWLDQIFVDDRNQADAWLKAHGRSLYMINPD